ncbi:MAG: polysaccharide deacetylase family protein [Anaerolineae bacterium]|nr:polysaccharide deacetylase family protein [Anaerolineae bacterium]
MKLHYSLLSHQKNSTKIMEFFFRVGLFEATHRLWPHRLTVLAYHRIADPHAPGFDTFKPNVSATPAAFAAQMDFVRQHFNVVALDEVLGWLSGRQFLPPNPLLITFDDGYRDNLDHALPVLQQRNLPAVIFLATDYMGQSSPFYWDLIAYCFYHTSQAGADLPWLGRQDWSDQQSRAAVMANWLKLLKRVPEADKSRAVKELPRSLGVALPVDAFAGLHLSWDQVRLLVAAGIDMGAHTQSHPILSRVSLTQARAEIEGSKRRIEAEIRRPVRAFAYPNGLLPDFSPALQNLLRQVGFEAAFTLIPGPAHWREAQQTPLAIRRIFVHHKDTLPRFVAKVMGGPRMLGRPR